ncbi:hypothetical protein A4A49_56481 [Nicotiana attenuata]|uniref:Uncharacterized protein n=1 Tax=Nicotiana attenuata TaxID=49451 RepID=A0A1J6ILY7_NICAT|nr:hypothetical protein A4A49_56481 [Nicotiana attenuata]
MASSKSNTLKRICTCSPTTHPGSFRCSFHRNVRRQLSKRISYSTSKYNWELAKNLAKGNSLKSLLLQIIKPSSHDLQRRRNFQPKPSRFFWMNNNPDGVAVS